MAERKTSPYVVLRKPVRAGPPKKPGFKANPGPLLKGPMRRKRSSRPSGGISLPPNINNTITVNTRIRYYVQASSGPVGVTVQNMFGALGGHTPTATQFLPWASSFKIKAIHAWPAEGTTPDEEQFSINWGSGLINQIRDEIKSADLPKGITNTSRLVFKPPVRSLASDWVASTASSSANIMTMSGTPGSIFDLHVSFTLSAAFSAGPITITSGIIGGISYLALDGPSSNTLIPSHLPTTN